MALHAPQARPARRTRRGIPFRPDEWALIAEAAAREGLPATVFLRQVVLKAAVQVVKRGARAAVCSAELLGTARR